MAQSDIARPLHSLPAWPARPLRHLRRWSLVVAAVGALALTVGSEARADADLVKAKNCMACHSVDKKLIGPSYKDVASKYAGDPDAAGKLAKKIREGGVGTWGQIPMPANPQVSADEGAKLAAWILSQK